MVVVAVAVVVVVVVAVGAAGAVVVVVVVAVAVAVVVVVVVAVGAAGAVVVAVFVVFDFNGTLALGHHRQHFLDASPKDWGGWLAAASGDVLCVVVLRALEAHLIAGHRVEIWSGCSDVIRDATEDWLAVHGIDPELLVRMRPAGDRRPDVVLKREWLMDARAAGGGPDLVYDDRDSVVAMWREEGVACFQVAPGSF